MKQEMQSLIQRIESEIENQRKSEGCADLLTDCLDCINELNFILEQVGVKR